MKLYIVIDGDKAVRFPVSFRFGTKEFIDLVSIGFL